MKLNAPLTYFGYRSFWSEDVSWLADKLAWHTLGHLNPRIHRMHLYLEELPLGDGVLARIQLDLAGRELTSVCAIRSCPQSALCAAFVLLRHEIEHHEPVAV